MCIYMYIHKVRYSGILKSRSASESKVEKDRAEARIWLALNIDTQRKVDLEQENAQLRSMASTFPENVATMSIADWDKKRLTFVQLHPSTVDSEDFHLLRPYFKRSMCSFWATNTCCKGVNCKYAHGCDQLN